MPLPSFLGPLVPMASPAKTHKFSVPIGGASANVLNFQMQQQQQSDWCWAATSASVGNFYAPAAGWTQCQVATACLGQQCCASQAPCNIPFTLDAPLNQVNHLQKLVPGADIATLVQNEIDNGRVVCCHISWGTTGRGHFVAISGYDSNAGDLLIEDPLTGTSQLPYSTFASSYKGSGVWDFTYYTQ